MTSKPKPVKSSTSGQRQTARASGGGPLMIALSRIDEDPNQPRSKDNPGFAPHSIAELAASYGPSGPKSPISLRDSLVSPGRYIINHGHRRFRAAKVKGLRAIPSFIDNDYNEIDQVIENLQRNELTAREIADWIGRELARGVKKTDIARSVGKSAAYITQHATLLNLPAPIANAFNAGRLHDITVVNELVTAYKKNPAQVSAWLDDSQDEVTRPAVKILRAFLEQQHDPVQPDSGSAVDDIDGQVAASETSDDAPPSAMERQDEHRFGRAIVLVEYQGRPARLNLKRRPARVGLAWLKYEDDGQEVESKLADVKLVALIDGST